MIPAKYSGNVQKDAMGPAASSLGSKFCKSKCLDLTKGLACHEFLGLTCQDFKLQ